MMDEYYLKDVCDAYPMLKSPVLFVLLGKRGKEALPFLKRTHGGMGDAVQMLQVADPKYKVQDPYVEFVNICAADWKDSINKTFENTIIPILKKNSYTMRGMINVNVLIDLDDENPGKLEELSDHIYDHLEKAFENSVDFYFYCFTAVRFTTNKRMIIDNSVIEIIQELYKTKDWVKLVYVLSDLNENDVYSSNNNAKKYLALVLNTYLQAGYHMDPDASMFDSYVFADNNNPPRKFLFQAMGCAPLELDTDLLKVFFKMQITQYLMEYPIDDQRTVERIFSCLGTEELIVTKTFNNVSRKYLRGAEYIAYDQDALRNVSSSFNNHQWLIHIFNNHHEKYFEDHASEKFAKELRTIIEKDGRALEREFKEAIERGEINPFHIANYEKLVQDLEKTIHTLELKTTEIKSELSSWEKSTSSVKKYLIFNDKMMNRFRLRIIKEWLELKKRIAIHEGVIQYMLMERDQVIRMIEFAKEYQHTAEKYKNSCKRSFSKLERAAFCYQTDHFEEYYTAKTNEALEHNIPVQEKQRVFTSFCKYMLDERNSFYQFDTTMEEFISGEFWRQARIKNYLIEEILDRMRVIRQKNADDVLTQLYISTVEAKNVDLRVIGTSRNYNDICCFMGPSDNEFISFLKRYKQKDQRVHVLVVEQLITPVVLYFKFNIPNYEIRI